MRYQLAVSNEHTEQSLFLRWLSSLAFFVIFFFN